MKKLRIINSILLIFLFCNSKSNPEVRHSSLAGTWYSKSPEQLASNIDSYLSKTRNPIEKQVRAVSGQGHKLDVACPYQT